MKFNKSLITNIIAALFVAFSFTLDEGKEIVLYGGLFALSGAITNQLAIHMLFEKVPFMYGSGVIALRFEAFKEAIKSLIMQQFFTKEQLENFFTQEEKKLNLEPIIQETDFTPAFEALSQTVMQSPFGGMLEMFGGANALEGLKEPFSNKMREAIIKIVNSEAFNKTLQKQMQNSPLTNDLLQSIEKIIDQRLEQLTPQMVKEMIQQLIREHLQWLVVWGGIFGGLLGVLSAIIF